MVVHAAAAAENSYRAHNPTHMKCPVGNYRLIRWLPPLENKFELNFDGSVKHDGMAVAGFVIRNHSGSPVVAGTRKIGSTAVLVAEYTVLKDGLLHALHLNCSNILVEGDSKLVIDCVNKISDPPWKIRSLVRDIHQDISSMFEEISFYHIPHEANLVADAIASLGHQSPDVIIWRDKLPLLACSAFNLTNLILV
ncbi:putative ribonuclease H-like domain-containing protein [Rosa chinensis]|uniref:Putative ribonuclease H-like domain-containing protein n=1 Tax=Rosa chinensis TaxID=74649 RepID=A0A2P6QR27_ROSCH|nr:uncharacterized protein LOC121052548 [Rosa chinensis]PRQ36636.1 putative ribonuclease H-like domain-containing protein [Rosa chinensis]